MKSSAERSLVTVMASSSANVEAPPTAGVQVTEGPLAAEVPAGAGDTNGVACALSELLAVKLGIGGGPCWPPAIHAYSPSIKVGTMAVITPPTWCCTSSWTILGIRATFALSSSTSRDWLSKLVFLSFRPPAL